jgi:hypothetical protein
MLKTGRFKLKMFLIMFLLLIMTAVVTAGCVCPLFSFFERLTGFQIKVGENIDESLLADELIYPDSAALVQVEGNIDKIVELIGQYGVNLSEKELGVLNELPQEVKEQEVKATVYSTADKVIKVLDYYKALSDKGWDIQEPGRGQQAGDSGQQNMLLAAKGDVRQAFMLAETNTNTMIIFIDFDWEMFSNMGEK